MQESPEPVKIPVPTFAFEALQVPFYILESVFDVDAVIIAARFDSPSYDLREIPWNSYRLRY